MASIFSWFKKRSSLKQASEYPIKSNQKSFKEMPLRTQSSNEKPSKSSISSMKRSVSVSNEPNFSRTSFQLNGVQRGFDRRKVNSVIENNFNSQKNRNSSFHNVSDYQYELWVKRLNPGEGNRHSVISLAAETGQTAVSGWAPNLIPQYSVPNGFIHLPQQNVAVRRKSDTMQGYVPKAVSQTNPSSVLFGIKHEAPSLSKENLLMSRSSIGQHRAPRSDSCSREYSEKSFRRRTEGFNTSKNDHSYVTRQLVQQRSCPEGIVQLSPDGNFYFTSSMIRDVVEKERCRHAELEEDSDATLTDGESVPDIISDLSSEFRDQDSDNDAEVCNRYVSCNENTKSDIEHKDSTQNIGCCNSNDIICGSFNISDVTCGSFSSINVHWGSTDRDDVTYERLHNDEVNWGRLSSYDVNCDSMRSDDITGGSLSYDEDFDEEVASILRQYDEIVKSVS